MFGMGVAGLMTFALGELFIVIGCSSLVQTELLYLFCVLWTLLTGWVCQRFLLQDSRATTLTTNPAATEEARVSFNGQAVDTASVLRAIWPQAFNVFFCFAVSLSLFPGVCANWKPSADSAFDQGNLTVFIIGLFQVFDVVGRYSAGPVARFVSPRCLVWLVLVRFAFIPLFILGQRQTEPNVFWLTGTDLGRSLLMSVFACSNGFAGSLAMMFGPELASKEGRDVAGTAMSCSMVWGIFLGCLLAPLTQIGAAK